MRRPPGFRKWHPRRRKTQFRWGGNGLNSDYDPKLHYGAHLTHHGIVILNGGLRGKESHDLRYEVLAHEILHEMDSGITHPLINHYQRKLGQILHDLLLSQAIPHCGCVRETEPDLKSGVD